MPKRILRTIGHLKPWKPTKSLPSYSEPTPETSRKLTREEEAEIALKNTVFSHGAVALLIALFLVTIASVPAVQIASELRSTQSTVSMLRIFEVLPSLAKVRAVRTAGDAWRLLPRADELKGAEKTLENESIVSQRLLPAVQSLLTQWGRAGNEQVYVGRDGWLFYRPDVDYVTAPPFLDPAQMRRRAHSSNVASDSVAAIVQFRDQLAARAIELVILPAPAKASVEAEKLSGRAASEAPLQNASFAEWQSRLTNAGVRVFDPAPFLIQRKATASDGSLYLKTDTHWRPETMEFVARRLGESLHLPPPSHAPPSRLARLEVTALGDTARMLKLPSGQRQYPPEEATIHQVAIGNGWWRPSTDADVLVLGDSFANIFSLEALGWGESAGLVEHLSAALGGRPIDAMLRNSDGAFATREMLANELAHGRDRLAGKKLVIWEFAARELAFGNWKLLELKLGNPAPSRFFTLAAGAEAEATGTIAAVSSAPRPGTVPYSDHVVAAHVIDLEISGTPTGPATQALVYLRSMHDNTWTPAARLRPGDRVTLKLRAWSDVAPRFEAINRSELDDPALQLEEPVWGEIVR